MDSFVLTGFGLLCTVIGYLYVKDMAHMREELSTLRKELVTLSALIVDKHIEMLERDFVDYGHCSKLCDKFEIRLAAVEKQFAVLKASAGNGKRR